MEGRKGHSPFLSEAASKWEKTVCAGNNKRESREEKKNKNVWAGIQYSYSFPLIKLNMLKKCKSSLISKKYETVRKRIHCYVDLFLFHYET